MQPLAPGSGISLARRGLAVSLPRGKRPVQLPPQSLQLQQDLSRSTMIVAVCTVMIQIIGLPAVIALGLARPVPCLWLKRSPRCCLQTRFNEVIVRDPLVPPRCRLCRLRHGHARVYFAPHGVLDATHYNSPLQVKLSLL